MGLSAFHGVRYCSLGTDALESPVMPTQTDRPIVGFLSADSLLVAAGRDGRPGSPLNMPPVLASNFVLGTERAYARDDGTPTWESLEDIIGLLEGGRAVAFASGMAGVAAVFDQLHAASRVVLPDDCYQGVAGLAESGRQRGLWSVTRLAVDDTDGWIRAAADSDLLWLESPSNPMLVVADLRAICSAPRKPTALLAVDNTFATPLNQRPLELGADISFQSATKFIGGHSDLLAGLVTVTRNDLLAALRKSRELHGATPGALESFLAIRGARTMALRVERAQANAIILAERLSSHSGVACTRFPGLSTHPTHSIARTQLKGYGTIISFDICGDAAAADAVCSRVRLIQHATSLGAVESTIERRASIPGQEHLPPSLLRLSVGVENAEDLWADLDAALQSRG
jgi:cystathionine gamma-synthase